MVRGHLVPEAPRKVLGQIGQVLAGGHSSSSGGIVAGQQMGRGLGMTISSSSSALVVTQWQSGHRLLVRMRVLLVEMRMRVWVRVLGMRR